MRGQHAVHDRKPGDQRDSDLDQRHPGATRNSEHERDEQDKANLKENRDSDDERDDHDRPVHAPFAEKLDQCRCDTCGSAGLRHHLAEHRAESDDDGDETENVTDAVAKRFHRGDGRHACRQAHYE